MFLSKRSKILLIITLYYTVLLGNNDLILNSIVQTILTYGILVFPSLFIISSLYDNIKRKINIKKTPLIISMLIFIWNIITIIIGINIGIQSIKALIFLFVLLMLVNIIINIDLKDKEKDNIIDHFLNAAFISMVIGIIQYFTGIRLNIFDVEKYPGILGRINSTFFIATLYDKFLILSGLVSIYMMLKNKTNYKYLFLVFLNSLTIILTFSRSGILVYMLILILIMLLCLIKKKYLNTLVILISLICMFLIPGSNYVIQSGIDFIYSVIPVPNALKINLISQGNKDYEFDEDFVNGDIASDTSLQFRDYYKSVGKQFVKENPIFGIGYGNYSYLYNNQNAKDYLIDDSVLKDFDYMYPHSSYIQSSAESGIVGTILLYGLMIIIFIYTILSKKFISIIASFLLLIALLVGSYTEGLFNAKQYIIIFIILYSLISNVEKKSGEKKIKPNKITFLLLHLGYGGIETSVINQANTLVDNYDIEIISFYKLKNNQANRLNKEIKVKYLYDGEPNKEKFTSSLKEHKYFCVIKEGLKAIDILIKKKILVITSIIKCNSKYIISTRYEFNRLLSKYGSSNSIKIAQEHHYHNNNEKYIRILSDKYNNIDYLFALTKTLEEDYKKFLENNNHTKVVLVPNMLYEIPSRTSNLKEKNIITVSRLDYGKKNDDIIRAFSKIEDKEWKLYIIGDGKEFYNLSKLIKELNLNDRVILTGYKNKQEIEEYMLKSSLFLMASLTEGLPMVLLEAMSYGIPCIAYETASGTSDIISDNINGYIIKERNEEEYIQKINDVISNEKLRKKLGANAKETSKKFSKGEVKKILRKVLK